MPNRSGLVVTDRPDIPGKLPPAIAEDMMRSIGQAVISEIKLDTAAGLDMNGRRFRPYSDFYRAVRQAAGYPAAPDLQVSGHMLRAVTVESATPDTVTISFLDTQQPARPPLVRRAWSRLSRKDRQTFWKIQAKAKRRAGKAAGVGGRGRTIQPLPSEKARWTHKRRPWFGMGGPRSQRRRHASEEGFEFFRAAYLKAFD